MNQGFRVPSLLSGILLLTVVLGWLVLGWSNRSALIPLFFLGGQTLTYPIVLWLLGAFLLGNGISFALLSLFQLIAGVSPGRSSSQRSFFTPRDNRSFPEEEWDEPEEERPASRPIGRPFSPSSPTVNATIKPNANPLQNDRLPSWDDEDEDWFDESPSDAVAPQASSPAANQTVNQTANQPIPPDSSQAKVNPNDRPSTVLPREDFPREDLPREQELRKERTRTEVPDEDETDAWDDPQWTGEESSPDPSPETIAPDLSPDAGKVYETEPAPRQGNQSGSTYSYRYRPSRRTTQPPSEPSQPRPASDSRRRAGQPPSVVDVNYRVINPKEKADGTDERRSPPPPKTPPKNDRGSSRNVANPPDGGWDQGRDDDDWD